MKHLIVIVAALGGAAEAGPVRHVPPAGGEAGTSLELVAEAPADTAQLVAHVRTRGTREFTAIELVRQSGANWVAVVPAASVAAPGLDYYVTAGDASVFASPDFVPAPVRA